MRFVVSLMSLPLLLCMLLDGGFVSTLSLVAEWSMGFPSGAIVFLFLSAAVGLCLIVFSGWVVGLVYWSEWEPSLVDGILCAECCSVWSLFSFTFFSISD